MLAMCINPLQLDRCDFCLSAFPTASHRSSLTRHFVVGISRMEVIAHTRTSSNDRRSHRYGTGIFTWYVLNFYCLFGSPPLILSLACDTILIISQEALFFILTTSTYSILPNIAGGLDFSFKKPNMYWWIAYMITCRMIMTEKIFTMFFWSNCIHIPVNKNNIFCSFLIPAYHTF